MGETRFKDVFPMVKLDKKIEPLFEDVYVSDITVIEHKRLMVISILCDHIIDKENVIKVENILTETLLGNDKELDNVIIKEKFELSSQYTPSEIMKAYRDSFLLEIRSNSPIMYQVVKSAEVVFNEDNILTFAMGDGLHAHTHADAIKKYFRETYEERFGLNITVGIDYTAKQKEDLKRANELRLAQELAAIEKKQKADDVISAVDSASGSFTDEKNVNSVDGEANKASSLGESTASANDSKSTTKSVKEASAKKNSEKTSKGTGKTGAAQSKYKNAKYIDDPDCFYGKNVEGDVIKIETLYDGIGPCVIKGQISKMEERELRSGKFIISGCITDFTDTIRYKIFLGPDDKDPFLEDFKDGGFYMIKGVPQYDDFERDLMITSIQGIKKINDFRPVREDLSVEKRVELHLHTVMSDLDSVVDIGKLIKRAKSWGMKSLAITDHGVLQAFPVAAHCLDKNDDFKLIYGVEGYFVDDIENLIINERGQSLDTDYVVFDIETTGLKANFCKIIEIGAVKISGGKIVDRFNKFVNPEVPVPYHITQLTSINDAMLVNEPTIDVILPEFLDFVGDAVVVAHNAGFDRGFIKYNADKLGLAFDNTVVDTMTLAHLIVPELGKYTLDRLCKQFNVSLENHHRACDDAEATAHILLKMIILLKNQGIETLARINEAGVSSPDIIKKAKTYHGIILVQNETGRINLNRLVSASHLDYFQRRPRMPKSLIEKYREGLIIGSACEAGELYMAIEEGKPQEEIDRLCKFYDYYEIQPLGNNMFKLESDKSPLNSIEDLQDVNKEICKLGEQYGKPVVATCDVHFLDPEDEIYRRIMMAGKGFKDADNQAPLYFRTTDEMLDEFQYLGSEKAYEVVIENTNKIADMIEKISPVHPGKFPPVIENSDQTLRQICEDKAHEIYGPELPKIVYDRLERELNSIISNGFAVMYIIAQKLVWKSNDDGYLVGSRGSVGSSFVATMSGITEVNPLPPHYICPKCHYVDFDSEAVKPYEGMSGCDMPDMNCPHCGTLLLKEGHDIPFETFLGFNGDKEPDIDLNFSSEYQPRAHAYTEELFGKGKAFRAGTIGTLAEKTSFGYVMKYFQERGITKRRAEIERIAAGIQGTKSGTGQHPGGMVVLPSTEEVYKFTAVQHPANDMNTDIVTTHFEYHSIDHNLLKLDILGHADPTMIRRLEDLTGFDAKKVPLDDAKVMSLFHDTSALGIDPKDIGGVKLGCLGIPEFGTSFAMQMLIDTKPKAFSDLARIAGLSHGTDVYLGNAETLIKEGTCELSSAICCRDDIMTYLIYRGLEPGLAFNIMEKVRKGMVAKGKCGDWPEWKAEMSAHNVPDWYIGSCEKIKYMFPKAHAIAYVMMSWRVAYYKVYYPLAYYTAYYSIRADGFDYEMMCSGVEHLRECLRELQKKPKNEMSATDANKVRDGKIVEEMYARGIEFLPIDLYTADAERFQMIDGKIMPSFSSIAGMGIEAAKSLQQAAKDGVFLSKQDIRTRGKVSKTILDLMQKLGILGDLPETNQYDLFSFMG